jgi:uncharacterized protein (TIGR04222 family)
MLELLRSIPGAYFLLLYPLIAVAAALCGRYIINLLQSGSAMPEPSSVSPTAIAALRGDWELVLKTVIFGMWQKGAIELVDEATGDSDGSISLMGIKFKKVRSNQTGLVLRRAAGYAAPSERLEMAVWKFLASERKPDAFFKDDTLRSYVQTHLKHFRDGLERKGLIRTSVQKTQAWFVTVSVIAVVMTIGLAKVELGIRFGMPTIFLLIMLPFVLLSLLVALRPYDKLTPLGKKFLNRLEEHFGWLKDAISSGEKPAIDPAYAFAIYGTTILAGTLLYAQFSEAFPSRLSSGCGGGSCGGGSCSGGGCSGGGGCGGCGGGGGD